eukprot:1426901-Pyramimonas_sp.AAC.1
MKLWSRLRQPYCKAWGKSHVFQFFWGSGPDATCERAGWVHNLLGAHCKASGLFSASAILDLA